MSTYYCSPTGTAGGTGASGDPWTLARACAIAGYATLITNGDTVILKDGTYHESMRIRTNGVTFEADNAGLAILDGKYYETIENKNIYTQPGCGLRSGTGYVVQGEYAYMVQIDANNVTLDGIEIRNVAGAGLHVGGNDCNILNVLIDYCYNSCIRVRGTSYNNTVDDTLLEDCVFTRGGQQYYANCDGGRGSGCTNNCLGGGSVAGSSSVDVPTCVSNKYTKRTIFRRCEIAYHNGEGINCGDGAENTIIEYCLIHNNNHGNIYLNTGTDPIIRHNLVWTGQRPEFVERAGSRFQPAIIIRDEGGTVTASTHPGRGQQIYNNIFIGGKEVFFVATSARNDTQLIDAYIGHNTFIGIGKNDIQDEITTNVIKIDANPHPGREHKRTIFENNIIIHLGTSGVGSLAPAKDVQGVTFRNNMWSRPNGGTTITSTPPGQYRGTGDIYTTDPKIINLIEPVDRGTIDGVSSYTINAANYGPKSGSAAFAAASNGSALGGSTIVNVTTDYFDAVRSSTKTDRTIGAIESENSGGGGGTVTAAYTFTAGPTGTAPLTVTVDESSSTTAGTLTRWIYDWGDGETEEFTAAANRTHVYTEAGVFTFKLTVENSNGISDSDSDPVTVTTSRSKPVMVDVRIDAVPTDASDLNISLAMDTQPPKAALFFMTSATATNTGTDPAMMSIGMWGKYTGAAASANDSRATANTWRLNDNVTRDGTQGWSNSRNGSIAGTLSSAGAYLGQFALTAVYNNGLTVAATDASPAAYQLLTVGFGGAGLLAAQRVVIFDVAAGESTKMTTPFAPDLIFVVTTYNTASSAGRSKENKARFSFGVATPSQAWTLAWGDNTRLTANRVAQNNEATRSSVGIESWDGDGVTFRRYGPAESIKSIDVLALNTGGRAALTSVLTPTSTAATDYPLAADPAFLMALVSQLGATGWSNSAPGGSAGIYVTDGTDDYTVSWRSVAGADPLDTGSRIDDKLRLPDSSGATIMEGAVALGTEEWTATLTTASVTPRLWPILTISETSAPTGPIADFSADLLTAAVREEVTFTDRSDDDGDTIELWIWDYGDGTSESFSVATNPTHEYQEPGRYTVSLSITTDAGDSDTETKVDYIRVIAPRNDDGEIYGPFHPETITNYSDNHVGSDLYGDRPGKVSHAADFDALWIDADGPNDGWVRLESQHKIKMGYDPETTKLRLIRPDGAQATITLTWSAPLAESVDEPEPDLGGTLVLQVSAGIDDANETNLGAVTTGDSTVTLTGGGQWSACRFRDVSIPNRATIVSALLEIYINSTSFDDIDMDVYGEDADDSLPITTDTDNISDRTRTTALETWTDAAATAGWKTSPDLLDVIAEITSRDGWASGNALTLIFDPTVSSNLQFRSYDHSPSLAAKLTIVYTT